MQEHHPQLPQLHKIPLEFSLYMGWSISPKRDLLWNILWEMAKSFFLRFFFLDVDHFLKWSTFNFLNWISHNIVCFMFWFFGHKACRVLGSWPGMDHIPPVLEGKILTTGPPGKSPWDSQILKPSLKNFSGQNQNLPKFTAFPLPRDILKEKNLFACHVPVQSFLSMIIRIVYL